MLKINITRREFIWRYLVGIPIAGGVLASLYTLLSFISPIKKERKRKIKEVGTIDEIPLERSKLVTDANDNPVMVINSVEYGVLAMSAICTHLGCIVHRKDEVGLRKSECLKSMGNDTHCVCHRGVYSVTGEVLGGPPPRPLPKYEVFVEGRKIYLGNLKQGERLYGA